MEKEIVAGQIGPEASYKVDVIGGMVKISLDYGGAQAKAGIFMEIGLVSLLEAAALKTDNTVDDSLVGMVKLALGA